jgi:hypothetical protein
MKGSALNTIEEQPAKQAGDKKEPLRIDFFSMGLEDPIIRCWFGGMYESFFNALRIAGCLVTLSSEKPRKNADVLVVPMGGGQDKCSAKAMHEFGGPVILNVGAAAYWFRKSFLERWHEQILFAYGADCSDYSPRVFEESGIPYYHLPFASTPKVMRPLNLPKIYDVVFVGNAGSGIGRHNYVEPFMRAINSERVLLMGPGWERYGFPSQSIAWGELLNIIYNLSHICINISNDEQKKGSFQRLDANNRLFDLAMAGCFQVSNAPQVVRRYFTESEVVAIDSPCEWVDAVLYYVNHPDETESFRIASRKRAMDEHTWSHRATQFRQIIEMHLTNRSSSVGQTSVWNHIVRSLDTHTPPYELAELVQKAKRRIINFHKLF